MNQTGCKDGMDTFYCFDCRWRDDKEGCRKFMATFELMPFFEGESDE